MQYADVISSGTKITHNMSKTGRQLMPSGSSTNTNTSPILWLVREYVYNDGASHDPQLADFATAGNINNFIMSTDLTDNKGLLQDNIYSQYQHKIYETEFYTDQATNLAFTIDWYGQVTVVKEQATVQTTIYTTGTAINKNSRLSVPLTAGITKLYVLTYTGLENQTFANHLDISAIGNTRVPLGTTFGIGIGSANFVWIFKMVDAVDFATPKTGIAVSVTISKNGSAFVALYGDPAPEEIGSGWYKVTVSPSDLAYSVVVLLATGLDCAQADEVFYNQ